MPRTRNNKIESSSDEESSSTTSSTDSSEERLMRELEENEEDSEEYVPSSGEEEDEEEAEDEEEEDTNNNNSQRNIITIPLQELILNSLLYDRLNRSRNERPSSSMDDDETRRPRSPFRNTGVKRCRNDSSNNSKKINKNIKRQKVNIIEQVRTLEDLISIADKYEDKPELHYPINISNLKALKEPLCELRDLIGLEKIKIQLVKQVKYLLSHLEDKDTMLHTALYGAPGSGKTTLAIIMAKIYRALGFSNGKIRTVKRADLVGHHLGETSIKTQKVIDASLGGVLFIDEIYSMGGTSGADSFAKEAIDTICQNLSENKSKFICIIAGYKTETEESFFRVNPGLERRFPFRYEIDNYSARDLAMIFYSRIKATGWTIDNNEIPIEFFAKNMKYFTQNGGDMENLSQKSKIAYSERVFGRHQEQPMHLTMQDVEEGLSSFLQNSSGFKRVRTNVNNLQTKTGIKRRKINIIEEINTIDDLITVADKYENRPDLHFPINIKHLKELQEPLQELKNMVGMDKIKLQIIDQIKFLLSHLEDDDLMLHTALYGPPGCGKTTLATILSKIYGALGFANGKMNAIKRSELVAGYLGQTAIKTQRVINKASGGVLFIDEAYSLGSNSELRHDVFSKEAIDTICQNLTEKKSEFICIIAGYKEEVKQCFFGVNPGLERRFPFQYEIENYTPAQLSEIFYRRIELTGWTVDEIPIKFFETNKNHFTENGGDMENLSQKAKMAYTRRIFGVHQDKKKHLTYEDILAGMEFFLQNKTTPNKDSNFDEHVRPSMYL